MSADQLVLFYSLALMAEVLGTVAGFGSSMLFVPLAGLFLDFHSVLGITAVFHVASNLSKIYLFRQGIDRTLLLKLGAPAIVGVVAGAALSGLTTSNWLRLALGAFLVGLSTALLVKPHWQLRPTTATAISGGSVSGLVAGLLGTGGAIRGLTLSAFGLPLTTFIATSAVIDLGVDASRAVVYAAQGYVHWHDLYLIPGLVAVGFIGSYAGRAILKKFSEEKFRNLVLGLVCLTGLYTCYTAW